MTDWLSQIKARLAAVQKACHPRDNCAFDEETWKCVLCGREAGTEPLDYVEKHALTDIAHLLAAIEKKDEVLKGADIYLNRNDGIANTIGTGSQLHRQFKEALVFDPRSGPTGPTKTTNPLGSRSMTKEEAAKHGKVIQSFFEKPTKGKES